MNLTPSQDQIMGQLRLLLPAIGMLLTTFGWSTPTEVANWTTAIMQAAGPVMMLGGMVWSLFANSRKSIMQSAAASLPSSTVEEKAPMVKAVAALPQVKNIDLDKTHPESSALNAITPSNVQVK